MNDEPSIEIETTVPPVEEPPIEGPQQPTEKKRSILPILSLIGLGALVAAGFYWLYQDNSQTSIKQSSQINTLTAQFNTLNEKFNAFPQDFEKLTHHAQALETQLTEIQTKQQEIEESIRIAAEKEAAKPENKQWQLAEAHYLLSLAEKRLQLAHDFSTAIAAMEAADQLLEASKLGNLTPIREQIISDVNTVRAAKGADIAGLALQISDIIHRVDELPLLGGDLATPDSDQAPSEAKKPVEQERTAQSSKTIPDIIWEDLRGLVSLTKLEIMDVSVFEPKFRVYLQQNLRQELTNARLAMLMEDKKNVEASIKIIQDLLSKYYDTNNSAVASISETLNKLSTVELNPTPPDISTSINLLQTYILKVEKNPDSEASALENHETDESPPTPDSSETQPNSEQVPKNPAQESSSGEPAIEEEITPETTPLSHDDQEDSTQ